MPLRDFECQKCGSVFEELCLREKEKVKCPNCGGKRLKVLLSRFSFFGKGGNTSSCATCRSVNCTKCK